ncbi:hypothetical protein [Amycolatopsis suaedae]|uniref:Uncharacterized protein n=1 Tax=Amycolatopsis suaedae TaxID=2510978 RepID=A0A4Q7J1J0_9PSEU|nr:hypothetical protein [Amycolatopsis suaedae]RZQ60326.1 hypothetical protein EWH70_28905 [Amycolatopsis suaedae]
MKQALRRSRSAFSQRFGVSGEQNYYAWLQERTGVKLNVRPEVLGWSSRGQASNCPIVNEILDRYKKYSPWQLHASLKEVFVGRVSFLSPNASAESSFGSAPYIAVSEGLYVALDQCLYLWENVGRLQAKVYARVANAKLAEDELRQYIENWATKRELPEFIARTIELKRFLVGGDPSFVARYKGRAELFELRREGVSDIDFEHRKRRIYMAEGFIIGHELAHILHGHVGAPVKKVARAYLADSVAANMDALHNAGELSNEWMQELQADLTGYNELLLASNWEQVRRIGEHPLGPDRSRLGLILFCVDGIAFTILAMYLVSALGAAPTSFSTHPHPDDRLAAIINVAGKQIEQIIDNTTELDHGPEGGGYFQRIRTALEQFQVTYSICKRTLENALNEL